MFNLTRLSDTTITVHPAAGERLRHLKARTAPWGNGEHCAITLAHDPSGRSVTIGVSVFRGEAPNVAHEVEAYAQDAMSMQDCAAEWGQDAALAWALTYEDAPLRTMDEVAAWRGWFTYMRDEVAQFAAWLPEGVTVATVADAA